MALRDPVSCQEMQRIIDQFRINGRVRGCTPCGSGHINDTFAVTVTEDGDRSRRYALQRINDQVFTNVPRLMENIHRVTHHLHRKLEEIPGSNPQRESLTLIPTVRDDPYICDRKGDYWRAYIFIENARTYDVVQTPQQAYTAGQAFAQFQQLLGDLPEPPLHETIPRFHHTPSRVADLQKAVAADACGRVAECEPEIEFVNGFENEVGRVVDALQEGAIPRRVTHNDTKLNNVLIDNATGRGICVIDLDTVMPGSVLYDFGDMVRTSTGHFDENETNLDRVEIDMKRFDALAGGYLSKAGSLLLPEEIELLPFSGLLITLEIGTRFLTDYLEGDTYFRIHHPRENLDRARCQFAFVRSIAKHQEPMRRIVQQYSAGEKV